jgi:flagellar biosynthetic protein FliO
MLAVVIPAVAEETETAVVTPSLTTLAFKLLLALVLIIAMIYLTAWVARRRWRGPSSDNGIRILAHHYVGPRKMIQLLQVGKRGLLIGVTERNISSLGELDAEELLQFTAERGQNPGVTPNFSESLKSVFKRRERNG